MQYDAKSPKEYFDLLEDDWRKDRLLEVRQMILNYGHDLEETIKYKMLVYGIGEQFIFGLNAQKSYVSLYVGDIEKIENASKMLEAFNLGKGCIRIRKSVNIHETGLEQFIKATIQMWHKGEDTSC